MEKKNENTEENENTKENETPEIELTPAEKRAARETLKRSRITDLKHFTFNLEGTLKDEFDRITAEEVPYEETMEDLTKEELDEWISRVLLPQDPNADVNRVEYSFSNRQYVQLAKNTTEFLLYHIEGSMVHIESKEALQQAERQRIEAYWEERWAEMDEAEAKRLSSTLKEEQSSLMMIEDEDEDEQTREEREMSRKISLAIALRSVTKEPSMPMIPRKKLFNQFNFTDRAAQTYETFSLDEGTQTRPTRRATLNSLAHQGIIFDEYKRDYEAQEMAKEKERLAKMIVARVKEDRTIRKPVKVEDPIYKRIFEGLRILERMLNQNTYDYIAMDCEFYEDPSDKYRTDPIEGTLLPLWQFKYNEAKNVTVTDLVWNPAYYDLFGVTFGTFDFCDPCPNGYLCIFTLKNPSFPEYVKHFNTGALCLDFHPRKCYFTAVGLINGGVIVQNIKNPTSDTPYRSSVAMNHTNVVWSVVWCDDDRERHLCFFSAGADGRICKWMLLETELYHTPILTLYLSNREQRVDDFQFKIRAMPCCMTFQPSNFEIFFIGSAVGRIFKCNISYASTYLYYIEAHNAPVHRISFNHYNPDIFASCSEDWRVKIWEDKRPEPYFIFDLDDPVLDVKWAPYSSTVFAAYVSIGKVYVYDLSIDKYLPLCKQTVICVDDNIGTRLSFNNKIPIIIVGDTRGNITSLKVSPNLRMKPKVKKKGQEINQEELEIAKLEKILEYVREPICMQDVPDEEHEPPKEKTDY